MYSEYSMIKFCIRLPFTIKGTSRILIPCPAVRQHLIPIHTEYQASHPFLFLSPATPQITIIASLRTSVIRGPSPNNRAPKPASYRSRSTPLNHWAGTPVRDWLSLHSFKLAGFGFLKLRWSVLLALPVLLFCPA